MLKTNFAPLYDISMMGNIENFADDTLSFPSSTFGIGGNSSIRKTFGGLSRPSDDPNFQNSTTVTSSVSKTPGSEIDNLKMKQDANINSSSSEKVTNQEKSDVSTTITNTDNSKQDKISSSSTSVTREQSEPSTTSDNSVPVKIDTSGLNKAGENITKTVQNINEAAQSTRSYITYFIGFVLLIGVGIGIFMMMNNKSKVKVNKVSTTSTISDDTLGTV